MKDGLKKLQEWFWNFIISFKLVSVTMSSQFNLLDERRATDFTREGLKTDMLFTVGDKIRRLAETLSALRAAMRFLSRVDKRMLFHVRFLVEPLATKFAGERPDSGVNKQMSRQR